MIHAGISSVTSAFSFSKIACYHFPLFLPLPVCHLLVCVFPRGTVLMNPPASAGDAGDKDLHWEDPLE